MSTSLVKADSGTVQQSRMQLFGKYKEALKEVNIDLEAIIETYSFFAEQQKQDPELTIPTYRAKIPSGGGRAFDIITGDEELDNSVTSFRGVVVSFHNCNALFQRDANGKAILDEPPTCTSSDGVKGIDQQTGVVTDCASCPQNQWGSAANGGRGRECKNMRRLYILAEGCDIPIVMTIPPTSIKAWDNYKSAILGVQRKSPLDVVTEFSTTPKKNADGDPYSVVHFKAVGVLPVETKLTVKALGSGDVHSREVTGDDYNADGPQATADPATQ